MRKAVLFFMLCLLLAFIPASLAQQEGQMEHYLLIGVDGWGINEEGGARSDAIILASLDYAKDRISFTSFARDSLVKPSYRKGVVKLNALVRSSMGEHMLVEYIEEAFGLPIDGYFVINFSGAVDVIDAIGGVDVELTAEEVAYLAPIVGEYEDYPLQEGYCRLNGAQAIYYMRCRSLDNDFGRQRRQGRVLQGALDALSGITVFEALALLDDVLGMYRTDLSIPQQMGLARRAVALSDAQMQMHSLPMEGAYRYAEDDDGASGLEFDVELCRAQLHSWLGLEDPQGAARLKEWEDAQVSPQRTPIVFAP